MRGAERAPGRRILLMNAAFSAAFISLYMLWSTCWVPLIRGKSYWIVASDSWLVISPARFVAHGAYPYLYGSLYGSQHSFDATPLAAVLLAPLVALGDRLGLAASYLAAIPHPTLWLLLGPFVLLACSSVVWAGRALAESLGMRKGLLSLQLVLLVTVSIPAAFWGHFEDALAVTFLLLAWRGVVQQRWVQAALLFSVAVACKQWALLAVPFLVFAAPRERRWRLACMSIALPVGLVLPCVLLDPSNTWQALVTAPVPIGNPFAHLGPSALLGARSALLMRTAVLLVSPLAAWLVSKKRPELMMPAMGIVLLVRALAEPLLFAYYLVPGMAVLVIWCATRSKPNVEGIILLMGAVLWAMPTAHDNRLWWLGEGVIFVAAIVSPVIAWRDARVEAGRREMREPLRNRQLSPDIGMPRPH